MTLRKHALMYAEFGRAPSGECKDCSYFRKYTFRGKTYRKCAVYGITNSEATDWLAHGHACGLFPDKPYGGDKDIVRMIAREPQEETQIQGQMSIFDMTEGAESEEPT